jgi:hypothetical protein
MKTDTSEKKMERIRYEHGRKADDYRNQKTTWIMQQNSSKLSKTKNVFPKSIKITQCNWGVGVGCFDSSTWQGHILDLLDWPCKTTIKQKFHISRKRKLPFPHLFRRKTLFRFRFHFRQKNSVSISVSQISVFVFIFSFCFRFSAKKSESFRSTFIPTALYWGNLSWKDDRSVKSRHVMSQTLNGFYGDSLGFESARFGAWALHVECKVLKIWI